MSIKNWIAIIVLTFCSVTGFSQKTENPKIVLITLDGLRWQELFTGADANLVANKEYVKDTTALKEHFWRDSAKKRRKALMPFLWNEVSKMGQIYGNREKNSKVNLTNTMWFSYPGYNEILSGKADDKRITSNSKINNPNKTVLELINNIPKYKGKVAAFGSWDVFPFIINEERSGIPVNAGFEKASRTNLTEREVFLNKLQEQTPSPWSTVRLDVFTHNFALEYLKNKHPEVLYIAYGETDDFAHEGHYDAYLNAAKNTDGMIKELWDYTQKDSFYKDNTIFIITTDHGRGTHPLKTWRDHGSNVTNADGVWLIIFGKGVSPKGEIINGSQIYTNQIAPTILELLKVKKDDSLMPAKAIKLK